MAGKRVPSRVGLVHRLPFADDGTAKIIEVDARFRVRFVDTPNWEHFWHEEKDGPVRRLICRYIPEGHGYRQVFVTFEAEGRSSASAGAGKVRDPEDQSRSFARRYSMTTHQDEIV